MNRYSEDTRIANGKTKVNGQRAKAILLSSRSQKRLNMNVLIKIWKYLEINLMVQFLDNMIQESQIIVIKIMIAFLILENPMLCQKELNRILILQKYIQQAVNNLLFLNMKFIILYEIILIFLYTIYILYYLYYYYIIYKFIFTSLII